MAKNVLIDSLSAPLGGATSAKVDIHTGIGNLTIDRLTGDAPLLASGTLEYLEKQGPPAKALGASNGQATLSVKGGASVRSGFRWPWQACMSAYEWRIRLNPGVPSDLTARSDGGNFDLDLAGMTLTRLFAHTAGGNVDLVLPDKAADLNVVARSGGGNVMVTIGEGTRGNSILEANSGAGTVVVRVPAGLAARVHARSGLGKVTMDPRFARVDANTFESPEYDRATDRIEITVKSGAGNVSVTAK